MKAIVVVGLVAIACSSPRQVSTSKLEFAVAPPGEVAPLVKAELAAVRSANRALVVYVGAEWCEPCKRFHDAVTRGDLDDRFGNLHLFVFDADRDLERLDDAGYRSDMIPLFALANDDGTATGAQTAGGIKGDGAVAQIVPRLRALLDSK